MRLIVIASLLCLSGCVNLTLNLGGTVNNLTVQKSSNGDMLSGGNVADETNTNRGSLEIPFK